MRSSQLPERDKGLNHTILVKCDVVSHLQCLFDRSRIHLDILCAYHKRLHGLKEYLAVYIMDSLNLDLGTYSVGELRKVFGLPASYNVKEVEAKAKGLLAQLASTKSMSDNRKKDVRTFLVKAADDLAKYAARSEGKDPGEGTWAESYAPTTEVDSHILIDDANRMAGMGSEIAGGRTAGSGMYPPGWLNPVNVRTISTGLNIDSRFREDYYQTRSSDYVLFLPEQLRKVVQLRLSTVELPMSFYQVSRARGDATYVIGSTTTPSPDPSVGPPIKGLSFVNVNNPQLVDMPLAPVTYVLAWLVILPDGNYELWQDQSQGADLADAMNTAISLSIPGFLSSEGLFYGIPGPERTPSKNDYLNSTTDIVFQVNRIDGRAAFGFPEGAPADGKLAGGFTVYFAVDYAGNRDLDTNAQLHLGWQLGFRAGTYTAGPLANPTGILSEGICMITGPRYAFISIDDGQKNTGTSLISAFARSTMDKNIVSRINLASVMDTTAVYKPSSDAGLSNQLNRTRDYFGPVDIQRLHIRVLDEYGRIIDFNHMDWSMTLTFDMMYS